MVGAKIIHRESDPSPDQTPSARCPRCGYDQRGVIQHWTSACPMTGVCTECGLEVVWSEVLNPGRFEPRWCVEFVRLPQHAGLAAAVGLTRASFLTLVRSLWPRYFWQRVKMSHAIRWRRLMMYIGFLLGVLLSFYVPWQGGIAAYRHYGIAQLLHQAQQPHFEYISSLQRQVSDLEPGGSGVVENVDWRNVEEQIRQAEIDRLKSEIEEIQAWQAEQFSISISYFDAILEAVLTPTRYGSNGTIIYDAASIAYPGPAELYDANYSASGVFRGWSTASAVIDQSLIWLCFSMAATSAFPVLFVLLPVSRRRAKVRWSHVARVWVYWLVVPWAAIIIAALHVLWMGMTNGDVSSTPFILLRWFSWLGVWVLTALWWSVAMRRYMKIPHALFVATALTVLLVLLTALVIGGTLGLFSVAYGL